MHDFPSCLGKEKLMSFRQNQLRGLEQELERALVAADGLTVKDGWWCQWIGLRENLNRKPMGFYHQI